MKFFKSTDEKFKEIGFQKIKDDEHMTCYERYNEDFSFTQALDICHKNSGRHIVQSYDGELFDGKDIGNTCVGLTYYEMKLAMKKMKEKGWKSK